MHAIWLDALFALTLVMYATLALTDMNTTGGTRSRLPLLLLPLAAVLITLLLRLRASQQQNPVASFTELLTLSISTLHLSRGTLVFAVAVCVLLALFSLSVARDAHAGVGVSGQRPAVTGWGTGALNTAILVALVGLAVFVLSSVYTWMQFQRSELGGVLALLMYVPCEVGDLLARLTGSAGPHGLLSQARANVPPAALLSAVIAIGFGLGLLGALGARDTWLRTEAAAGELLGTGSTYEPRSPYSLRAGATGVADVPIIVSGNARRLADVFSVSLTAALDDALRASPNWLGASRAALLGGGGGGGGSGISRIFAVRVRLYVNEQQDGRFYGMDEGKPLVVVKGTFYRGNSDNTTADREEEEWVALHVTKTGWTLRSKTYASEPLGGPLRVPLKFRRWYDVMLQCDGTHIGLFVDGTPRVLLPMDLRSAAAAAAATGPKDVRVTFGDVSVQGACRDASFRIGGVFDALQEHDSLQERELYQSPASDTT